MEADSHGLGRTGLPASASRKAPMSLGDRIAIGLLLIAFLTVFTMVCLPGKIAPIDVLDFDEDFSPVQVEHGWPLTFLTRDLSPEKRQEWLDDIPDEPPTVYDDPSCPKSAPWRTEEGWRFAGANTVWQPWSAAANGGVAFVMLAGVYMACRWRVRQRGSLFRFTLLDASLAAVAVSVMLAWWRVAMTAGERDLASARSLGPGVMALQRYCGPDWLARLAGAGGLPFWRTTLVLVEETDLEDEEEAAPAEPLNLSAFDHLEYLALNEAVVDADIIHAVQNPRLKALELKRLPKMTPELRQALQQCRLPGIALETLDETNESYESLEQFVSVRSVNITFNTPMPDALIAKVASMPALATLTILRNSGAGPLPDLRPLAGAKELRRLNVLHCEVHDDFLAAVAALQGLTDVRFIRCIVDASGLARLQAVRPDLNVVSSK